LINSLIGEDTDGGIFVAYVKKSKGNLDQQLMSSSLYYLGSVIVNDTSIETGLSWGLLGISVSGVVDPTKLQRSFTDTGH
jgi:hypothetical protein